MRNASAFATIPAPGVPALLGNPAGDFHATPTLRRMHEVTGRVLSEMPHAMPVTINGTIDLIRIYGDENDPNVFPTAAVLLNSGTDATTVLSIDQRHYLMTWGNLVRGHAVSVYGKIRRPEPDFPPIVDLVRLKVLRKAGA